MNLLRAIEAIRLVGFRLGLWRGFHGPTLPWNLQERVSTLFIIWRDSRFERPVPAARAFFLRHGIEVRFSHKAKARLARKRDVTAYQAFVDAAKKTFQIDDHLLPIFIDWCRENECEIAVQTPDQYHPQHRPWSKVTALGQDSFTLIMLGCDISPNRYTDEATIRRVH